MLRTTTACTFSTSQLLKVVRAWCVLYILTSKCASRHNGVHFFNISTFKSGPSMVCFVHFDLDMCFVPQRRALFQHLNFQKWSENGVLCTFSLRNVLRATTACAFFDIATSKSGPNPWCFSHFDFQMCFAPQRRAIFHLSSGQLAPHPAALASLLFDPPEPQIMRKTQCFATFLPFRASPSSFLLIFLFSLPLPCSAFHLSILSEV